MIRLASSSDYPTIADISIRAIPQNPLTIDELHRHDADLAPHCKLGYLVAKVDEQIVGFTRYIQWADTYHPHMFNITVQVHPDHQRQGIGTELYASLNETLQAQTPQTFKSFRYDVDEGAQAFCQKYGFVDYSRRIESRCDLTTFDASQYDDLLNKLEVDGFTFTLLSDVTDDETLRDIYDLQWSLELDVPIDETLVKPSFEHWGKHYFESSSSLSEASIVAKQGDKYAGLTQVFKYSETRVYTDFTGTRPHFRRMGVGLAMKVLSMKASQELDFETVGTTNDAVNAGMLAMNDKLGFVPQSTRIQIGKIFTDSTTK